MFSSTPSHAIPTPLAVPQTSALKRKREPQTKNARVTLSRNEQDSRRNVRGLAKLPIIANADAVEKNDGIASILKAARIFHCGDVLSLYVDKLTISLNALDHSRPATADISCENCRFHDIDRQFSILVGPGNIREILACSGLGELTISTVEVDGKSTSSRQTITLDSEQERISCVQHAGGILVVGTSCGSIYTIRKEGRVLVTDRLQRPQSIFLGLVKTGAKMLGLSSDSGPGSGGQSRAVGIIKILPVPGDKYVLSLGRNMLSLWSDYTFAGREMFQWEENVKELILNSIPGTVDDVKVSLLDGLLMPIERGDTVGTLLLLSTANSGNSATTPSLQQSQQQNQQQQLWLHVVEFELADKAKSGNKTALSTRSKLHSPISIRSRILLTSSVAETTRPHTRPKLHRASPLPCWRVLISWFSLETHSFHTGQVDVKFLPVLSPELRAGGSDSAKEKVPTTEDIEEQEELDRGKGLNSDDTGVGADEVLSSSAVDHIDGVCFLLRDGTVLLSVPPAPDRLPRRRLAINAGLQSRTAVSAASIEEAARLLSASCHEVPDDNLEDHTTRTRLKSTFANLSSEEVSQAVMQVSGAVLNRSSTGHHWGALSTSSRAVDSADTGYVMESSGHRGSEAERGWKAQYQLAHKLISDKAEVHSRLLDLLIETGILAAMPIGQEEKVLCNHQLLLGCAGLSTALQEAQQRTSSSTHQLRGSTAPFDDQLASQRTNEVSSQSRDVNYVSLAVTLAPAAIAATASIDLLHASSSSLGLLQNNRTRDSATVAGLTSDKAGRNARFLHIASREALRIVGKGIERSVEESLGTGCTSRDLAMQGLSAADVFFSEAYRLADGFQHIANTLRDSRSELLSRGVLLPAAYGTASCLFSAIQRSQFQDGVNAYSGSLSGAYGGDRYTTALICIPKVRGALIDVLSIITSACTSVRAAALPDSLLVSSGLRAPSGALLSTLYESLGLQRNQEGRRLKTLCDAILKSFTIESTQSVEQSGMAHVSANSTIDNNALVAFREGSTTDVPEPYQGENMPDSWKKRFQNAKEICVTLLLQLGYTSHAFEMSARYLYFRGLLEAVDLEDPHNLSWSEGLPARTFDTSSFSLGNKFTGLRKRLRELVKAAGSAKGTEDMPLVMYCMEWLEVQGRPVAAIELGRIVPEQLDEFLKDRANLAWMHHIRDRNFAVAAQSAVNFAAQQTRTAPATTLLSIAKLSAALHTQQLREQRGTAEQDPERDLAVSVAVVPVDKGTLNAAREAEVNLAVIKAQELVEKSDPDYLRRFGVAIGERASDVLVIDGLIHLATVLGIGAVPTAGEEAESNERANTPTHLSTNLNSALEALATAIGQISIRKDLLETRVHNMVNVTAAIPTTEEELHRESQDIRRQLTQVWGTALKLQQNLWLHLAARSLSTGPDGIDQAGVVSTYLGAEAAWCDPAVIPRAEDEAAMAGTVFALLVCECRAAADKCLLRQDIFPVLQSSSRGEGRQRKRREELEEEWVVVGDDDDDAAAIECTEKDNADVAFADVVEYSGIVSLGMDLDKYAPSSYSSSLSPDPSMGKDSPGARLCDRMLHLIKCCLRSDELM